MPKAVWNGTVIAESDDTVVVEGNHSFRPEDIKDEFFTDSDHTTKCFWKGTASYYDVEVDGARAEAVAWTYKDPSERASMIKDHVAFYPKVTVETGAKRGLFRR